MALRSLSQELGYFVESEKGSFHFRATSEGEKGEHVIIDFEYGITTKVNVLPTKFEPVISLPYVDLLVSGFESGTWIALRYAVQLPSLTGKRGKKPATASTTTQKAIATPGSVSMRYPVNKQGQISLVYGTTYLHYSEVMYYLISS